MRWREHFLAAVAAFSSIGRQGRPFFAADTGRAADTRRAEIDEPAGGKIVAHNAG